MFGAPVAYLFEYLLGIRQKDGTAGYRTLTLAPMAPRYIERMSGSMRIPAGVVSLSYETRGEEVDFCITIPEGVSATLTFEGKERTLAVGENRLTL
jgi:hypothetical protein